MHERFAQEQPLLIPLRAGLAYAERVLTRVVNAEGAINYGSNVYELPRGYRRRELIVRDDGRRLRVFADGSLVYEHPLLEGSNQRARRREIPLPALERAQLPEPPPRSLAIYDDLVS